MTLALIILIFLLLACVVVILRLRSELRAEERRANHWRDEEAKIWLKLCREQSVNDQMKETISQALEGTKQ